MPKYLRLLEFLIIYYYFLYSKTSTLNLKHAIITALDRASSSLEDMYVKQVKV